MMQVTRKNTIHSLVAIVKRHDSANVLEKFHKTLEEDALNDQPWQYRLKTCAKSMFGVMGFVIWLFKPALTSKPFGKI